MTTKATNKPAAGNDKLKEMIVYVAERSADDQRFGATKLNKILFYADFLSYANRGCSITGATYMRLPNGPAPKHLVPVREQLIKDRHIAIQFATFHGRTQKRPVALRSANLSRFNSQDVAIVDSIIQQLRPFNAADVSALSHQRAWRIAEDGEEIPYCAALLSDENCNEDDVVRARQLNQKHRWETECAS